VDLRKKSEATRLNHGENDAIKWMTHRDQDTYSLLERMLLSSGGVNGLEMVAEECRGAHFYR
jgi:hypothetical protein